MGGARNAHEGCANTAEMPAGALRGRHESAIQAVGGRPIERVRRARRLLDESNMKIGFVSLPVAGDLNPMT
jgi:hypothetical protein